MTMTEEEIKGLLDQLEAKILNDEEVYEQSTIELGAFEVFGLSRIITIREDLAEAIRGAIVILKDLPNLTDVDMIQELLDSDDCISTLLTKDSGGGYRQFYTNYDGYLLLGESHRGSDKEKLDVEHKQ